MGQLLLSITVYGYNVAKPSQWWLLWLVLLPMSHIVPPPGVRSMVKTKLILFWWHS